ncbi:putative mercuric reductase [Kluyvera cryocrescens]|uniref:Putative mercuric reductase n=1 Tax=Kluyvera cryocrescens TaxID=580 RepID=A0A485A2R0_KLUCR|nr:putative mercuric reductase [Kluyvera cryocrescens]
MKKMAILALLWVTPFGWAADKLVTIDVGEMNCPLCVISINQALRSTDGVIKAKASLKTRQAQVVVPENFDNQRLLAAIAKTGFKARSTEKARCSNSPRWEKETRVASGFFYEIRTDKPAPSPRCYRC